MKKFFLLKQYIFYLMRSSSAHGVHSPFVFDFIKTVLKDQRHFYAFDEIKKLREQISHNNNFLTIEDMGAGSHQNNTRQRKIADIGRTAGRNEKFGKLLFRLVEKYQPKHILELGTSLGIGSSYLAMAGPDSQVYTIEGSGEIADQATKHFAGLGIKNIHQCVGNFDIVLEDVLKNMQSVDLLFVDGNHRKEPTLRYFEQSKPFLHPASIVIFDDIHWSPEMHEAWEIIKRDPSVTLSIDLFFFGIVFFRKEFKEKQDFVLKF